MKLSDFFKKRQTEQKREEITPPISDPLLRALLEGEAITREKAMTLPAVAGNVDFISNMIASTPVLLYKRPQGKIIKKDNDTRVTLLKNNSGDTLNVVSLKLEKLRKAYSN